MNTFAPTAVALLSLFFSTATGVNTAPMNTATIGTSRNRMATTPSSQESSDPQLGQRFATAAPAPLTLINASIEQTERVDGAVQQFADAGLDLPALRIEFYDDLESCNGYYGLYTASRSTADAAVDQIKICYRSRVTVLHELAHAWLTHHTDDAVRTAFTNDWELERWNDQSDAWGDRGVERAAHTIAFTLYFDGRDGAGVSDPAMRYVCRYELLTQGALDIHNQVECPSATPPVRS